MSALDARMGFLNMLQFLAMWMLLFPCSGRAEPTTGAAASDVADVTQELIPDIDRGELLARTKCAECHTATGNSTDPSVAKISQQFASYLIKQLTDMREGRRDNERMKEIVAALDDQAFVDVAAWYESQARVQERRGSARVALPGKRLWVDGRPDEGIPPCILCHGKSGQGYPGIVPGGIPLIGAQNAQYVEDQLKRFRDGDRDNDPQKMMRFALKHLSDQDIHAVSVYVAGLKPPGTLPVPKAPAENPSPSP